MTNPNALPSADKALNTDAYFRLYQGALKIEDPSARLAACYIILLAGRLGLRLQEIQHLREEWIDWRRGETRIPSYDPCGCKRCWLLPATSGVAAAYRSSRKKVSGLTTSSSET